MIFGNRSIKEIIRGLLYSSKKHSIKWINYEFCSSCNLRCKWCTLDHNKKSEFISSTILRKSLDEIIKDKRFDIERIDLHNAGEILLHPKLEESLLIIAEKKKSFKNTTTVHLLTNAVLLNDEKARIILNSWALDEIRFSIDGGTKEFYDQIRLGSNWQKVRLNVLNFLNVNSRHPNKIKTGVICIVPPEKELTTEWMDDDFKELFSKVDNLELRYPHNWDGSKDLKLERRISDVRKDGSVCYFLLNNLVILPNGDVTVCCADLNSRGVIGNINKNSLSEIYLSDNRMRMLRLFKRSLKNKIALCKPCTGYYE